MKKFKVYYTKTVRCEALVDAIDRSHANELVCRDACLTNNHKEHDVNIEDFDTEEL